MSEFVMTVLDPRLRRDLEDACVRGRRASERACRVALVSLGVTADRPPSHLDNGERALRRGLRAKARQLGDIGDSIDLLVGECAYAQWHRLLFARFLAENELLIHPDLKAPVTLVECEELAGELGELDGWGVAARFAAAILPGIFRLDDPPARVRLAPEGRLELERIVARLPTEVFTADDALGWVYQFWQRDKKDEVNASERKIGGADLGPVTQLFTESYMVRFLLENSLGAWWTSRHPDSALLREWGYLRFGDNGLPAAGSFERWPDRVAEVTVMDPCCGSGHFLVEAFSMLWQMRVEEEGLQPVAAQDAVLRENLFGLELDPRCVQIAMFAVALQAWKVGRGWRELPVPHIACSGIPVKASVDEWKALSRGDERLEKALTRLHVLFGDADTLGSLIDPKQAIKVPSPTGFQSSFEDVNWDEVAPLLARAVTREADDPATAVLGADAAGIARAADYLSRQYTLVATNVPYLKRSRQSAKLADYCDENYSDAKQDLALVVLDRMKSAAIGTVAVVLPRGWLFMSWTRKFRERWLRETRWDFVAQLGTGAFRSISGEVVNVALMQFSPSQEPRDTAVLTVDQSAGADEKAAALCNSPVGHVSQRGQLSNPDAKFLVTAESGLPLLARYASGFAGIQTGDYPRFGRFFWELEQIADGWERQQSTVAQTVAFGGREHIVLWEDGQGDLLQFVRARLGEGKEGAWIRGTDFTGRSGVAASSMSMLPVSLYTGELFDNNTAVILPHDEDDLPAIWAFASSSEFAAEVRRIDTSIKVTNATFVKVPFDVYRWHRVAAERFPGGLPEPSSDDPTQWLFDGRPEAATDPLQVAVGRLLGYRWPNQVDWDELDAFADDDGIVCLPSVLGERTAADRLRELLARAFGVTWLPAKSGDLLSVSGSRKKDLESWLREDFFKDHCKLFRNRPFVWHIWDSRSDGFAALVNYHRLDRAMLQRLTFTYLGDWIERQMAGVRDEAPGAEERFAAAQELKRKLQLILEGERPHDIYVRWKSLAEQPIGWEPDLNDGVRLNVRPFVEAEVLRSKFKVKWGKDRGKDPDGSERLNDRHLTRAAKETARGNPHR